MKETSFTIDYDEGIVYIDTNVKGDVTKCRKAGMLDKTVGEREYRRFECPFVGFTWGKKKKGSPRKSPQK